MRCLITGGAGFIGSHLAEELLQRGARVTIIDDLSTGSVGNIRHLKASAKFQSVIDTVMNRSLLAELIDDADIVYHLAAAVGVKLIVESPVRTIETNIQATEMVLSLANKKKRPVFVASTSEVYGLSDKLPFREDGELVFGATTKGRWSYACSKAIDEFLAVAYFKEKKLPTVVARLFNTVGPRQTGQYGMVVPTFARQAVTDAPITVFGDGTQSRCFCHVKDVVRGIIGLADTPSAYGQVFNIGSTEPITIDALARSTRDIAQSKSSIVHVPYDEAYEEGFEDIRARVPDTGKIQKLIGWRPSLSLGEILHDVVDYIRSDH